MGNDVVEAAQVGGELAQIELQQADVGEGQVACHPPGHFQRPRREVDADEGGLRQCGGSGQEVRAVAAGELEHPCGRNRRNVEPEERCHRSEMVRMAREVRVARVRDVVVRTGEPRRVCNSFWRWFGGHAAFPKRHTERRRALSGSDCILHAC